MEFTAMMTGQAGLLITETTTKNPDAGQAHGAGQTPT
jgi:hypothetical protein